ncbi:MAG: serine/threonine-protein kinase [Polyangiaceae bacterium]
MKPGTIIGGDFRLVRPLSEGGMGTLYVAEQLSTSRQRAVKLLQPQLCADARVRQRFEQEARISASIESDHVVSVIAAGITDGGAGVPWIAMELLNGQDLAAVLAHTSVLDREDVRLIAAQLFHAIGAAHSVGIVHRDLKPENIFLARTRRVGAAFEVKVLDFGIAKLVADGNKSTTQAMGTPLWLAPEQATAGAEITPAADVWALGLILYRLLVGELYWRSGNADSPSGMAVLREMLMEPLETASARAARSGLDARLPAGFDAWFERTVNRDPRARFPDARVAWTALEPLLRAGSRPPPLPASARQQRTSKTVLALPVEESFRPSVEPPPEPPSHERVSTPSSDPRALSERVATSQALVEEQPLSAPQCRTLLAIAHRAGDADLRWRAARLLVALGEATEDERRLFGEAREPLAARRPLDASEWQMLSPPSLDPGLLAMFACAAPALARATARSPRADAPRPDPTTWIDPSLPRTGLLPRAVALACAFLGIPEPVLYVAGTSKGAITAVHGEPMAIVLSAPQLSTLSPAGALFVVTRYLAGFRAELYVPHFIGSAASLKSITLALASLASGRAPHDDGARTLVRTLGDNMRPAELADLRRAVEELDRRQPRFEPRAVLRDVQIAAARAAMVLANDVEASCQSLAKTMLRDLDRGELARDLCSFWIGSAHGALRARLGAA